MEMGSNLEVNAPESGGGEEGKAEKGLSHPQPSPVSLPPASAPRIPEYSHQDLGPERKRQRSGSPSGRFEPLAALALGCQRFLLLGDSQPPPHLHCLCSLPSCSFMNTHIAELARYCTSRWVLSPARTSRSAPFPLVARAKRCAFSAPSNTRPSASHPLSERTTAPKSPAEESNRSCFPQSLILDNV